LASFKGVFVKVKDLMLLVVLGAGALYAYDKIKPALSLQAQESERSARRSVPPAAPTSATVEDRSWIKPRSEQPTVASASSYQCDGRTHCSQMRSCDEAKYFIQHCPNTEMDGDGDGIPCERQWCN